MSLTTLDRQRIRAARSVKQSRLRKQDSRLLRGYYKDHESVFGKKDSNIVPLVENEAVSFGRLADLGIKAQEKRNEQLQRLVGY